jgi:hypothetical protein
MSLFAACALGLSTVLVAINLNYSLLAMAIHRLREGRWPLALPLGVPALGSLCILLAWWSLPAGHAAHSVLLLLLLLDTGGPLAWAIAYALRRRREAGRRGPLASLTRHPLG